MNTMAEIMEHLQALRVCLVIWFPHILPENKVKMDSIIVEYKNIADLRVFHTGLYAYRGKKA